MKHFFDVGANEGQTFDCYLNKGDGFDGATIWCFEPSPRHLSVLRTKCDEMAATDHNWRINICGFGLAERTGWRRLFEKNDGRGDSFYSELFLGDNYIENRETSVGLICPIVDVVHFIRSQIVPPDSVTLKLDTEGSEFPILWRIVGAPDIHKRIDKLLIEWHCTGDKDAQIDEQIRLDKALRAAEITQEGWPW